MLKIGLTGGIGSGKSSVAEYFASMGVAVIDTDQIAHQLVEPGQEALKTITEHFGPAMLDPDGRLNRARLAAEVFSDPTQRVALEAILHPRIRNAMQNRLKQLDAPYCVLVIPLLLESGWQSEVDRILLVDIAEEEQIRRVQARDDRASSEIEAIIRVQCSRAERLRAADDVIDNSSSKASLRAQVQQLHKKYLALASAKS